MIDYESKDIGHARSVNVSATVNLLGEVREFKGGQVADLGHWLVVFKNNKPDSLFSTGVKIRKFIHAPVIGARVASLNTMPQDIVHQVRGVATSDGYSVPSCVVSIQVRLTPEERGAPEILLDRISRHGHRFFDSIESEIRRQIDMHVRSRIGCALASDVLSIGPIGILFPKNDFELGRPEVEVTSLQGVDWVEGDLTRDVRDAHERHIADRAIEQVEWEARERRARSQAHQRHLDSKQALDQQALDAELAQRQLKVAIERAQALGLDPVAIAEPEVWRHISEQHGAVLVKLLESPHLYAMLRSSPDLMRAIVDRLGGGVSPVPLGRQADMVLDGIDPQRVMSLPGATVHSATDTSDYLDKAGLVVNALIADAWRQSGGGDELRGAGYAIAPGQDVALVLLMGDQEPMVPRDFAENVRAIIAADVTRPLSKVGVYTAAGRTLLDAVRVFVQRLSDDVRVRILLRQNVNRREAVVELAGPERATATVFARLTDPSNPILPALESLVDNRAQIRFVRRGV